MTVTIRNCLVINKLHIVLATCYVPGIDHLIIVWLKVCSYYSRNAINLIESSSTDVNLKPIENRINSILLGFNVHIQSKLL